MVFRNATIDGGRAVSPKPPKKNSTGVYTTGGMPAGAQNVLRGSVRGAGTPVISDKKVTKDGRTYTYRGGQLMGVSTTPQEIESRNVFAGTNQAAQDFADQTPDYTGANLSTGGSGVAPGVQSATDALIAALRGGSYGQEYDPSIGALEGLLGTNRASLQSGAYMAPVTAMQGQLSNLYGQAQGNIGAANTALMNYLAQNMTNPFANVQAQTGVADPALAGLLEQQGVSGEPLQAEVAAAREAAQVGGGQFQNLLNVMSGLQTAGLQSRQSEQGLANLFAQQALEANKAGYGQQLLGKGEELRQGLEQQIRDDSALLAGLQGKKGSSKETLQGQLIELLGKGGKVDKGTLTSIFGTADQKDASTKTEETSQVTGKTKGKAATRAQAVKQAPKNYGTFNKAVKAMHPNFKGSIAEAKKKFPKLAASFQPKKK
jgi:hypothetical protein